MSEKIELIHKHIAPYVPLLLLDQFGNYVVQCCLRMGPEHNQYIFDAIVDKCWEIGQGRFGARAVRAILENSIVTKEQQVSIIIKWQEKAYSFGLKRSMWQLPSFKMLFYLQRT